MEIYLDGSFVPEAEARVSVFDHGLLYGDGVFEGVRVYDGGIFMLDAHIRRLYESARAILLSIPMEPAEMAAAALEAVRRNDLHDGYLRIVVTRGVGDLGLNPRQCPRPSVIIIAADIALYPEEKCLRGLSMATCATRRPAPDALPPQIKSLNYLNNILAKIEALEAGADEGLMLNAQGCVAECSGVNVFIIKDGRARTPPASAGALRGITRDVAMEILAEMDVPCDIRDIARHDVWSADECFLTGTAAEIIPATSLDGRSIGDGRPGPLTRRCRERFRAIARERAGQGCGQPLAGTPAPPPPGLV